MVLPILGPLVAVGWCLFLALAVFHHLFKAPPIPASAKERNFSDLLVGHRGCKGIPGNPENSMSAFKLATAAGVEAIELDCRMSSDGVVVVIHNRHLHECFEATGNVHELKYATLRSYNYLDCDDPDDRIATLEDVLSFAQGRGVKVLVELKVWTGTVFELARKVSALIVEKGMQRQAVIISFNPVGIYWARRCQPEVETCMLWCDDILAYFLKADIEVFPAWLVASTRFIDGVVLRACRYPSVLRFVGVSLIGPIVGLHSAEELLRYQQMGFAVYLWVENDQNKLAALLNWSKKDDKVQGRGSSNTSKCNSELRLSVSTDDPPGFLQAYVRPAQ